MGRNKTLLSSTSLPVVVEIVGVISHSLGLEKLAFLDNICLFPVDWGQLSSVY